MNVSTDNNEHGGAALRKNTSVSEGTGGESGRNTAGTAGDNPLMKLVDAALNPTAPEGSTAAEDGGNNAKETTAEGPKIVKEEHPAEESKKVTSNETEDKTSTLQDAKVLKGNVQDLMARQEKKVTFAEYLMEVLNDDKNNDVLQWMPCGKQFTITNHRKFTMERMPALFKIRNMSSFVRKLTRWGFSRVHEKETGNSDIFKHPLFQRDKPESCKKIRCVNRATTSNGAGLPKPVIPLGAGPHPHPHHHPHGPEMMGNMSESSFRHRKIGGDGMDYHMTSPRRSISHATGGPYMPGRSPHHYHTGSGRYGGGAAPRVSPEYEKEMIAGSAFRPRGPPGPPQVYSPPPIGRSMSAAAEYELEQVLLERQRARAAMYREQQAQRRSQPPPSQPQQQPQQQRVSPSSLVGPASERAMASSSPDRARYGSESPGLLAATNSVVTAALETLQREGDYDLDMSPREAMLRAVLHKRQQQRAQQQQQQRTAGGGGGVRAYPVDTPPPRSSHPPSSYYR